MIARISFAPSPHIVSPTNTCQILPSKYETMFHLDLEEIEPKVVTLLYMGA